MEMLSEHQCEGWLEGYLLTGRHGLFNCYEAFIHIIDSMFNQHAKWLKITSHLPWRRKIASLNYLLASHVWRQVDLQRASRIRTPVLSIMSWQQEGRRWCGFTFLRMPIRLLSGDGPPPAQPPLCERRDRRQTSGPAMAGHGCRGEALHGGHRYLAVGEQ